LRYDQQERLTAREAMQHPYFDSVRNATSSPNNISTTASNGE
jgi:hypothetical protein